MLCLRRLPCCAWGQCGRRVAGRRQELCWVPSGLRQRAGAAGETVGIELLSRRSCFAAAAAGGDRVEAAVATPLAEREPRHRVCAVELRDWQAAAAEEGALAFPDGGGGDATSDDPTPRELQVFTCFPSGVPLALIITQRNAWLPAPLSCRLRLLKDVSFTQRPAHTTWHSLPPL